MCACSCDSSVLTCEAHLFWRMGTLRCHWRPRPHADHPLTTRAKDVQGGMVGEVVERFEHGYTQRFTGTLATLCSHCTVFRVGESL